MATKKKKTTKKTAKKVAPAAPKLSPREQYLLVLIRATERYVTGKGDGVDEMMTAQRDRLRAELEALQNEKGNPALTS